MKMETFMKDNGGKHPKTEEENSMRRVQGLHMKGNGKIIRKMGQDC